MPHPRTPARRRGFDDDGIYHVTVRYGFSQPPDIPRALGQACSEGMLSPDVDPGLASYFLSRAALRTTSTPGMSRWRKLLFVTLAHNAANPAEYFGSRRSARSSWAPRSTSDRAA
ncbi:MAG: KUP/HAK/KT family potassium transporter [Kineosporiaceae bacterium]